MADILVAAEVPTGMNDRHYQQQSLQFQQQMVAQLCTMVNLQQETLLSLQQQHTDVKHQLKELEDKMTSGMQYLATKM